MPPFGHGGVQPVVRVVRVVACLVPSRQRRHAKEKQDEEIRDGKTERRHGILVAGLRLGLLAVLMQYGNEPQWTREPKPHACNTLPPPSDTLPLARPLSRACRGPWRAQLEVSAGEGGGALGVKYYLTLRGVTKNCILWGGGSPCVQSPATLSRRATWATHAPFVEAPKVAL